jgi:hypothetical protein
VPSKSLAGASKTKTAAAASSKLLAHLWLAAT